MENYLVSEAPRRSKASRLLTFGAGAAAGFVAVGVVYYVSTSQDDTSTVAIARANATAMEGKYNDVEDVADGWKHNLFPLIKEDDVVEDVESDADDDVSVLAQEATAMKRRSMKKPASKAMKKRSMRKAMKKDDDEEEDDDVENVADAYYTDEEDQEGWEDDYR